MAGKRTAVDAWGNQFKGDAADVLLRTISDFLNKQRRVYARGTWIINSSGTGKSRMVDQVAMTIITIPMCLRAARTQGFPPSDVALRNWFELLALQGRDVIARKLHVFLSSLFVVLRKRLAAIASEIEDFQPLLMSTQSNEQEHASLVTQRQGLLAHAFRKLMTTGQTFDSPNEYRKRFYDEVINETEDSMKEYGEVEEFIQSPPRYELQNAGSRLCEYIDPQGLLDSATGPRRPLVILNFDEAHLLTNPLEFHPSWTIFSELQWVLREVVDMPIFSLFVSTAGRPDLFSPETQSGSSSQITTLDPISEISFDDLAYPAYPNSVTLDRVVELDWISHLGRPLFGSYYDVLREKGDENDVMIFAEQKLLNNKPILDDKAASLACLCVRFALEFGTNPNERTRATLHKQIEQHMRLCIAATTGFEEFVTIAGSEPLLAEAAFECTRASKVNPVHHLANHSDLYCVDRDRHGELVAALIIMQARDMSFQRPRRWMPVCDFFKALLPSSAFDSLLKSFPRFSRENYYEPFGTTFQNYAMWFNHIIKIEDNRMIAAEHLWSFITRGAMIMCTDNQAGVDIVLPVCVRGERLGPKTVTAVLIQVKNSEHYGHNIDETLFGAMDRCSVGLFPDNWPARPIIRMVFALGSDEPGVLFPISTDQPHDFTAFDVWCAGLSSATFNHIGGDEGSYKLLLQRSLQSRHAFDLGKMDDNDADDETRERKGFLRRRLAALTSSKPGHNYNLIDVPPT
ncbi:hypothetical protein BC826DRAFT_716613 [Russula brevipes]|nr:hypothetical protein BC826DRAFT_716613 [Russula brevipes]